MSVDQYFTPENQSLVKTYLTQEIYDSLKGVKTKDVGYDVDIAIQTCKDNQDSGVGIYAGDEDSYFALAPIFDPIIDAYHGGYSKDAKHKSDMDPSHLKGSEEKVDDFVISTRIRVGRNIRGYGLSPGISREQRSELEKLLTNALTKLTGDLSGKYFPLLGMSETDRIKLVEDHFLFKKGDRFLESCGANRDWPEGRGIFHNDKKTFLVWINEEDQLRIISMQSGGDFVEIFDRLGRGIKAIEASIKATADKVYMFNDHHGFIHSCPTNLGTGMRASVHIKLPKLSADKDKFYKTCADLKLQPRGVHGEHSESKGGIYDVSNKHRIGYTEVELVQTLIDGVSKLIALEKAL
uniref:arginine kinase n=1 Tax=Hirondellea gigas TaxID=1518452 RepID=A0A6A7G196_9CRUS